MKIFTEDKSEKYLQGDKETNTMDKFVSFNCLMFVRSSDWVVL